MVSRFIIAVCLLPAVPMTLEAQSMYMAKHYYEQGNYLEAAKQLRPLADGGDAEAQTMASRMFLNGQGVQKSEAQALKYAKMAANKGNEEAMRLVCDIYYRTRKYAEYFKTLQHYITQHPYLEKKELGMYLAACHIDGIGTEKNETKGWQMLEINGNIDEFLTDKRKDRKEQYINFKMRQSGKKCIEDYADYVFEYGDEDAFKEILQYIDDKNYKTDMVSYYMQRAKEGNGFAKAWLANYFYDKNGPRQSISALQREAAAAGSAYGRWLEEKVNFVPATYNSIRVKYNPTPRTYIESVKKEYGKTTVYFVYQNNPRSGIGWIATAPKMSIRYRGKDYNMLYSSLPVYPNRRNISATEAVGYYIEFQGLPMSATTFDIIDGLNRDEVWKDITLTK